MALKKRNTSQEVLQGSGLTPNYAATADEATTAVSPPDSLTITYEESLHQVPWQTDNDYITKGYRRQLPSIRACLMSSITCEENARPFLYI
jgi:hypothetical protein